MPCFPRHERLLKRGDFLRLSSQGQKVHTSNFVILWQEPPVPSVRIGITVSGKVGNAVTRNRLKRLIREFYRQNKGLFLPRYYNIIAKQGAARLEFSGIIHELGRALQRTIQQQC